MPDLTFLLLIAAMAVWGPWTPVMLTLRPARSRRVRGGS